MNSPEPSEHIEQIRDTRDDRSESEVQIFVCPIEDCSRTTVGSPRDLRSHVRQAGDDAHRFRTLNEELAIEFDEEAYHDSWGPGEGGRNLPRTEPVVKSAAETDW